MARSTLNILGTFTLLALGLLPAGAAEPVTAPADPELRALEQEILDELMREEDNGFANSREQDLNYNGRRDPQERALALAVGAAIHHTRPGDLVELALRDDPDREAFIQHYRQTHPGPAKGQELRRAIEEEKALLDTANLLGLEEKGTWREQLKARLLLEEDTNRNGLLDHDELVRRGATDRLLQRFFSLGARCFDTNGNGMLEPGERLAILEVAKEDFDLDGDGQVSEEELERLEVLPFSARPEMPFPIPSRQGQEAFAKTVPPEYDRNGDGRWQPRELDEACRTEEALRQFAKNLGRPFSAETRGAFVKEFLACRDLNGNGRIELAEIPRRRFLTDNYIPEYGPDPLDLLLWRRLSGGVPDCRLPDAVRNDLWMPPFSMRRISQDPRIPPLLLAKCRIDILGFYDFDHDGQINAEEAWVGLELERFLEAETYGGRKRSFATPLEQLLWISKMRERYDRNHDGRLDPAEAFCLSNTEEAWKGATALDRNHDGWLDPEERQAFEDEALKHHDRDSDGILDQEEVSLALQEDSYKQQLFGSSLTPAQQAEWEPLWALVGPAPGERVCAFSLDCLSSMLFEAGTVRKPTCQDIRAWHAFMLKHHDLDHDGRINAREVWEYQHWCDGWRRLAELKRLPASPASMPELRKWALAHGDLDHDGQLTRRELESLCMTTHFAQRINTESNQDLLVLQKIDPERATLTEVTTIEAFASLIQTLARHQPEFDQDKNGTLDQAERLKFAQALLREGDRNGNGRLDYEESYRLLRQHHATAEEATLVKHQAEEKEMLERFRRQQEEQERRRQEEQRRRQEAEWLGKYDLNGNGKLDPEEWKRAEQETRAGLKSPAREE